MRRAPAGDRNPGRAERDRPAVVVFCHPDRENRRRLREITAGLEEEGVPYRIENGRTGDAVENGRAGDAVENGRTGGARELAFAAARASTLGVGVGVDAAGNICVHHAKLPPDAPALAGTASDARGIARTMGHNAARLVVGIPFKQFEKQEDSSHA